MRTDLELARDHARSMAAMTEPVTRMCSDVGPGGPYRRLVVVTPVPTPAERRLWVQLADEIDAHLTRDHDDEPALDLGGTL